MLSVPEPRVLVYSVVGLGGVVATYRMPEVPSDFLRNAHGPGRLLSGATDQEKLWLLDVVLLCKAVCCLGPTLFLLASATWPLKGLVCALMQ